MNTEELTKRFTHHPPFGDQPTRYEAIRNRGLAMADFLGTVCPESRELSLAMTHLEQAIMWANAAIARNEKQGD